MVAETEQSSHPLAPAGIGSRTHCGYQNPWMLKCHSWPSMSWVPHPQIQWTADHVGKKKVDHAFQTHVVQESTVFAELTSSDRQGSIIGV